MKSPCASKSHRLRAFTLIELLAVVGVLAILVVIVLPALTPPTTRSPRIKCVLNLKNLGIAWRIYAVDNGDQFPWQTNTITTSNLPSPDPLLAYLLLITNELSVPKLLACPSDNRTPADAWTNLTRTNISYFLSLDADETQPQSILAGDRNLLTNGVNPAPGRVKIPPPTTISWSPAQHQFQANLCMADGSVQQSSSNTIAKQWRNATAHLTNQPTTLLFP